MRGVRGLGMGTMTWWVLRCQRVPQGAVLLLRLSYSGVSSASTSSLVSCHLHLVPGPLLPGGVTGFSHIGPFAELRARSSEQGGRVAHPGAGRQVTREPLCE